MSTYYPFFIFILLITALFFVSRTSVQILFEALLRMFKSQKVTFSIISFIFFPGTVLHEFAHALCAMVLMLRVREIHIFPEWEGDQIKLGKVLYEKKDFLRGILVGVAPIFVGLIFFFMLSLWNIFPHESFIMNILLTYLIFVVSTTLFSSKQDLKDLVYVLPLLVVLIGIIYVFDIPLSWIGESDFVIKNGVEIVNRINGYLLVSLTIHIGIMSIIKLITLKR